jgi:hypothetical protein
VSDEPKRASHEDLLAGRVYSRCIINEPLDEPPLTALAIARRRWGMTQEGEAHERQRI